MLRCRYRYISTSRSATETQNPIFQQLRIAALSSHVSIQRRPQMFLLSASIRRNGSELNSLSRLCIDIYKMLPVSSLLNTVFNTLIGHLSSVQKYFRYKTTLIRSVVYYNGRVLKACRIEKYQRFLFLCHNVLVSYTGEKSVSLLWQPTFYCHHQLLS